jgi:hypothetical protein
MTDEWPPPTVSVLDGPRKHPIRVCTFGADVMFLTVEEAIALASDLGEAVGQIRNSEPAYPPHRYWQDAEGTIPATKDGDQVMRVDTPTLEEIRNSEPRTTCPACGGFGHVCLPPEGANASQDS